MKTRTLSCLFLVAAVLTGRVGAHAAQASGMSTPSFPASSTNLLQLDRTEGPRVLVMPEAPAVSGWVRELVKLAEASIEQSVLLSYIDSAGTFNLTADQIIFLHDLGVPGEVIKAVMKHDADILSGKRMLTAGPPPSAPGEFEFLKAPPAAAPANPPAATPPEPEPELLAAQQAPTVDLPESVEVDEAPAPVELYPVRKPYAVPLTTPVIIMGGPARVRNITVVRSLR